MELTDPIKKAISAVLKKYKQQYEVEFAEFVKHVMNDKYEQQEIVDRIESVKLRSTHNESQST